MASIFGAGGSEPRLRTRLPEMEEQGSGGESGGTSPSSQNLASLSQPSCSSPSAQESAGDSSSLQGTPPSVCSFPQDGGSFPSTDDAAYSGVLATQAAPEDASSRPATTRTAGGGLHGGRRAPCLSSSSVSCEAADHSASGGRGLSATFIQDPSLPPCHSLADAKAPLSSSPSAQGDDKDTREGARSFFPVSCFSFSSSTTTTTTRSFVPYTGSGGGSSSASSAVGFPRPLSGQSGGGALEESSQQTTTYSSFSSHAAARRWGSSTGLSAASSPSSLACLSRSQSESYNPTDDKRLPYTWLHPEVPKSPGPRAAHSCDVIGNKLFLFGGWNGKCALGDLYVFDTQKLRWLHVKQDAETCHPPKARNNHATATVGDKIFLHGGHDGSQWLADLHVLDTTPTHAGKYSGLVWSSPQFTGSKPCPRACHSLTRVNEKLYLYGGFDGHECFQDLDVLDLETMAWIRPAVSGKKPKARNAHTMTAVGTKLVLCGGHSGKTHITDVHVFDTATLCWSEVIKQNTAL